RSRLRRWQCSDEAGLAGRGIADESDVGDRLELEHQTEALAALAQQGEAGSLALRRSQSGVAQSPATTGRGSEFGALVDEIGDDVTIGALDHRTLGHGDDEVRSEEHTSELQS